MVRKSISETDEEITKEDLENYQKALKASLDMTQTHKKELEADVPLNKFLQDYSEDIQEDTEQSWLKYSNENKVYDIFSLTHEDLEEMFCCDEDLTENNFFIPNESFSKAAIQNPKIIKPEFLAATKLNFTEYQRRVLANLRKRINCIMIYYRNEEDMNNRKPSTLCFEANILLEYHERWIIPSGIPISLPIYVIAHFRNTKTEVGIECRRDYTQRKLEKEEVEQNIEKTKRSEIIGHSHSSSISRTRLKRFVMFKPLSAIKPMLGLN